MLNSKLWNSVFWPHVVFRAHPCGSMESLAHFDGDVVFYLSPVPAIAIRPGVSPGAPGEDTPEEELLTHRELSCQLAWLVPACTPERVGCYTAPLRGLGRHILTQLHYDETFQFSPNRWWGLTLIFSLSSWVTSMPCTSLCFWISRWERTFKFCLILWTLSPVYSLLLSFLWGAFFFLGKIFKFCFVQIDLFFFPNYDFLKREVSKNIS